MGRHIDVILLCGIWDIILSPLWILNRVLLGCGGVSSGQNSPTSQDISSVPSSAFKKSFFLTLHSYPKERDTHTCCCRIDCRRRLKSFRPVA